MVDRVMQAFDAIKRYKAEMTRRSTWTNSNGGRPFAGAALIQGSMGNSAGWAELSRQVYPREERKGFNLTSHHVLLAYLRRLAGGGAADPNFEARTLQADLRITPVQLAVTLYGYARERGIPTYQAFQYMLPPAPCDDDAIPSHFMKVMASVEVGRLPEQYYLDVLLQGFLSETDDVDFLFLGLMPHADNVRFAVSLCRSLESLRRTAR
jgi:hypothetical protein